jgi:hypothetical protein
MLRDALRFCRALSRVRRAAAGGGSCAGARREKAKIEVRQPLSSGAKTANNLRLRTSRIIFLFECEAVHTCAAIIWNTLRLRVELLADRIAKRCRGEDRRYRWCDTSRMRAATGTCRRSLNLDGGACASGRRKNPKNCSNPCRARSSPISAGFLASEGRARKSGREDRWSGQPNPGRRST